MSVEFENDEHAGSILYAKLLQKSGDTPSLVNWLTSSGIVKTETGANRILVCVMILSFFLTGYTAYNYFIADESTITPEQQRAMYERLRSIETKKGT